MTYAFLIDGLDAEGREKIDQALNGGQVGTKSQAQRERAAITAIMGLPKGGASK